jgi:glycerol-3-phosphate acyltransferase PlsX
MISQLMKQAFMRNLFTRLAGVVALPVINAFRKSVDTRRYNGASLVGLNGIVVKSHGGADATAFEYAILVALAEIQKQVPQLIGRRLASMHAPGEPA